MDVLGDSNVIGMVGSPAPIHCETIVHLARIWHKNLVTWTCPYHATSVLQPIFTDKNTTMSTKVGIIIEIG